MTAKTYTLLYPFEFEGKTITEVSLRRAKGRDLERMEAAGQGFTSVLTGLSCITDLPLDAVRQMDGDDIAALSEISPDFLPKARGATGGA